MSALFFFQFPFHRDSLCNGLKMNLRECIIILSVPFSSGFTLQPKMFREQYPAIQPLSVPFSSGFTLQLDWRLYALMGLPSIFQFPFHRDSLCNGLRKCSLRTLRSTFSSLFIGIHSATNKYPLGTLSPMALSVPFSSGFTLQL